MMRVLQEMTAAALAMLPADDPLCAEVKTHSEAGFALVRRSAALRSQDHPDVDELIAVGAEMDAHRERTARLTTALQAFGLRNTPAN